MEPPKPTKITIERSEDDKLELTINWDADLGRWEEVFRVILKWWSFDNKTIDEFFGHDKWGKEVNNQ